MIDRNFITAGKAIFTIQNAEGEHYTYRVMKSKPSDRYPRPTYFLSVMTGTDNEAHYTYVGVVNPDTGALSMTTRSRLPIDDRRVLVARYALQVAYRLRELKPGHDLRHSGKCGRCGRTLTNPESLDTGIGPECAKIMGPAFMGRLSQVLEENPELRGL